MLELLWNEDAQDLVEYTLLMVLIALAAVGSATGLATAINGVFANAAKSLQTTT